MFFPVTALCSSLLMVCPATASKALQDHPSLRCQAEISVPGIFHGTVKLQSETVTLFIILLALHLNF